MEQKISVKFMNEGWRLWVVNILSKGCKKLTRLQDEATALEL